MEKLKCFTFLEHGAFSTLLLWISLQLEALSLLPRIYGIILNSFSTKNYCFNTISTFTPTKPYPPSNAWKYSATWLGVLILFKKDNFIGTVLYPLHFMDFNCGTITKLHLITLSRLLEKCNEEQHYRYQILFEHLPQWKLKLLQALFLYTFI